MLQRTLVLPVPVLLGAACASIQQYETRDTDRMLAAAGFQVRLADTPERQADLRLLPPRRIVSRTEDGSIVYTYGDPEGCQCLYVGGTKEYSEYERLRAERNTTLRTAARAGGAPSTRWPSRPASRFAS